MINNETMDKLSLLGFGADIDAFEEYVSQLMDAYAMGKPIVEDSQYDAIKKLLQDVKPESELLIRNCETEEAPMDKYDSILKEYGMTSIHTIDGISLSSMSNMVDAINNAGGSVTLCASLKYNGHATRIVYAYGSLMSATTRGRYSKGRDITRHARILFPTFIKQFESMPLVEIRAEVAVKANTFNQFLKPLGIKTALSSVTSLIRESASDEEIGMLTPVSYKLIPSMREYRPRELSQEFEMLRSLGLNTAEYITVDDVTVNNLVESVEEILEYFESFVDENGMDIDCDGIVIAINNNNQFYSAGKDGNAWKANFALKDGKYWQSSIYSSTIEKIVYSSKKKYLTPTAIIEPVMCRNGAIVENVPLYNIGVMDRYQLYTGQEIYFKFGGEKGVTLCDEFGNSVRVD